jgi:1-acyl-sn-glycerol-3-phosphate acyltransferase
MLLARSILFTLVFYLWSLTLCVLCLPTFAMSRGSMRAAARFWARGVIVILGAICGTRVELRGREHMPTGRALIAAKHLCMFDVFAQLVWLPDPCFVMRKELLRLPLLGWYARKARTIVIDREGGARALRDLIAEGKDRLRETRQIVIFPEGTRGTPGVAGDYHPGVAGLYRELGLPAGLMATNSGKHWPAHGILRRPGVMVFEYLPPLHPGLKRAEFMREVEDRIETASNALLDL